jgi:hypothetical protein
MPEKESFKKLKQGDEYSTNSPRGGVSPDIICIDGKEIELVYNISGPEQYNGILHHNRE